MRKIKIKGFDEVQEMLKEYREGGALELQQYRAIGTVEECREAGERQRGKKPNKSDAQPYFRKHYNNIYSCPLCNKKLTYHKQKFCQYCGQAISWEGDTPLPTK